MNDYRSLFVNTLSKGFVEKIVLEVFNHPEDFQVVFKLMFDDEERVAWRAGWACSKISEKHPDWFLTSHIHELIQLSQTTKYEGLLRACLAIMFDLNRPQ
jgi:hypothetical protein